MCKVCLWIQIVKKKQEYIYCRRPNSAMNGTHKKYIEFL